MIQTIHLLRRPAGARAGRSPAACRWRRSMNARRRRSPPAFRTRRVRPRVERSGRADRMAALLRRRAPEAADRTGAGQQPRPARGDPEHRAGARAVPDPARRHAADRERGASPATACPARTTASPAPIQRRLRRQRVRTRPVRPRAQPVRGRAGAIPGHRGSAQERPDQPDRLGRQRLPGGAGRRRTARDHPPDAGRARRIAQADPAEIR